MVCCDVVPSASAVPVVATAWTIATVSVEVPQSQYQAAPAAHDAGNRYERGPPAFLFSV